MTSRQIEVHYRRLSPTLCEIECYGHTKEFWYLPSQYGDLTRMQRAIDDWLKEIVEKVRDESN